ncbi:MAG TPA: hypothetical protein VJ646_17985 [Candidatus Binatia bacterium]|nr:hypothetical protein [Candidatus Binatia bacterium]
MVVDDTVIGGEKNGMKVAFITSQKRIPVDTALSELFQQVTSNVRGPFIVFISPFAPSFPVAFAGFPKANGCRTKTGVRLDVAVILQALDSHQFVTT